MISQRNRMLFFLLSLLLLVIMEPLLHNGPLQYTLLIILSTFVMLFGIYAVNYTKLHLAIAWLLALPAIITTWSVPFIQSRGSTTINLLLLITFYAFTAMTILQHIFRVHKITREEIYGAISAFILIGVAWGVLYMLIVHFNPEAFIAVHGTIDNSSLIYFSFVTIGTLGYGDILPVHPVVRMLASIEAIMGLMYIATLIASIVSAHTQQQWRWRGK